MQNEKPLLLHPRQNKKLLEKLSRCLSVFDPYIFTKQYSLPYRIWQTKDHLYQPPPDDGRFSSSESEWGGPGITCWFLAEYTPSSQLKGKALYLMPQIGGYEGLLWINGTASGTFSTKITVTQHGNHYCDLLCTAADCNQPIHIALEFYAGHYVKGCQPFESHPDTGFHYPCGPIWICTKNQIVADFLYDLRVLLQLVEMLGEDSFRSGQILNTLTKVHEVLLYDPESSPWEDWIDSLKHARKLMRPALEATNGTGAPEAVLLGHSHMDTAWLWPVSETIRKNARTISNQLSLMNQFPEYRFLMSSACHYKMLEEHYPALFEDMKKRIDDGRLEVNGAVWVECDCNLPGGESMIRQFLWGQRYTLEKFNKLSDCFWLPDTFGYSAAIPQIMKGFGVKYFLTTKLSWNDTNQFPFETFHWVGLDGSEVLTHFFVMDTWPDPKGLLERINGIHYKNGLHNKQLPARRLIAFGYGDGGGGPQFEMIEIARRLSDLEGCPKVHYDSASHFMKQLENEELPSYRGELYLELHRGTLTNKQQIKRNNRMAEHALHALELLEVLSAVRQNRPAEEKAFIPLWETLLRNQFHDILPGSCIPEAHDRSIQETDSLLVIAKQLLKEFLHQGSKFGVFNPTSFARDDVFYLPAEEVPFGIIGARTQQVTDLDGCQLTAVAGIHQKPLSHTMLVKQDHPSSSPSTFKCENERLYTPFYIASFLDNGTIVSLIDRRNGRELCTGMPFNTFLTAEDVPAAWDGWDIDADCLLKLQPDGNDGKFTVVADGCVEYRMRCRRTICKNSWLEQDIIFYADSPLIVFDTVLHWNSPHHLLKVCFDTTLQNPFARYETQFGCVQRATTRNTAEEMARFEVCNHKYTDLSEPSYGITLLNDCKYASSVENGRMTLTLANGGVRPDDRGDIGIFKFRYGLYPHVGGYCADLCVRPAYLFNYPAMPSSNEEELPLVATDSPNIVVETVKPCENSTMAFILRLYECEGTDTRTKLLLRNPLWTASVCDMMENRVSPCINPLHFRPFEIKTIRVIYQEVPNDSI